MDCREIFLIGKAERLMLPSLVARPNSSIDILFTQEQP